MDGSHEERGEEGDLDDGAGLAVDAAHFEVDGEAEEGGEDDSAGEAAEGIDFFHGDRLLHGEGEGAIEEGGEFVFEDGFGAHGLDFLGGFEGTADKGGEAEVLVLDGGGIALEVFAHAVDDPGRGEGEDDGGSEHDPDAIESEDGENDGATGEADE